MANRLQGSQCDANISTNYSHWASDTNRDDLQLHGANVKLAEQRVATGSDGLGTEREALHSPNSGLALEHGRLLLLLQQTLVLLLLQQTLMLLWCVA